MVTPGTLGDWISRSGSRVRATKSVMAALQWGLATVLPVAVLGMIYGPPEFRPMFYWVFLGAVLYFGAVYTYWSFKDPDRLHTEEHREHMAQLTAYRDSTGVVLDNVANTAPPQIEQSGPPSPPRPEGSHD
jgi:hypothetical protein